MSCRNFVKDVVILSLFWSGKPQLNFVLITVVEGGAPLGLVWDPGVGPWNVGVVSTNHYIVATSKPGSLLRLLFCDMTRWELGHQHPLGKF